MNASTTDIAEQARALVAEWPPVQPGVALHVARVFASVEPIEVP
jgi:hypothetical protein